MAALPGVRKMHQRVGLVLGALVFALMLLADGSQQVMAQASWRVAAVGLLMGIWWATEALPVPVTAFLPIAVFPLLGISSVRDAAAPYANPVIYLFLGAFVLALAVQKCNLHRRLALMLLARTGTGGRNLVGGFMLCAALLSMWMTNTSTTIMLLPVVLSVVAMVLEKSPDLDARARSDFQRAMTLGLAFAATIGGLSTLVGTPPNAFLAGFLEQRYQIEIGFVQWMQVGLPVSAIMLPIAWLALTRWVYKVNIAPQQAVAGHLRQLRDAMPAFSVWEKRVAIIFALVILGWVVRRPLTGLLDVQGISDAGIVMAAAILLFIVPGGGETGREPLMSWEDLRDLPWGVLVLFGGGLSLAAAISGSGLAQWLGESLAPLSALHLAVLLLAVTGLVIFLTELTGNLSTAAAILPVMASLSDQLGLAPLVLCVPVTLAASCAFMLPVATPPNAVVFASGMLSVPDMVRAGLVLNLVGMLLLAVVALWWAPHILGVSASKRREICVICSLCGCCWRLRWSLRRRLCHNCLANRPGAFCLLATALPTSITVCITIWAASCAARVSTARACACAP